MAFSFRSGKIVLHLLRIRLAGDDVHISPENDGRSAENLCFPFQEFSVIFTDSLPTTGSFPALGVCHNQS